LQWAALADWKNKQQQMQMQALRCAQNDKHLMLVDDWAERILWGRELRNDYLWRMIFSEV